MEISLTGTLTLLRSVELKDAEFIADLRSHPQIYRYLSSESEISTAQQQSWLKAYLDSNDGFYFVIEDLNSGKKTGTISIYNLAENRKKAEFGRYICTNTYNAIEAELLLIKFGFEVMGIDEIYCRTAQANEKVWKQHYKFGFTDLGMELFPEKEMALKVQHITKASFDTFDYTHITNLIQRFRTNK